jgi:putative phage-type endonuclease
MKVLDLKQNTPEWEAFRKDKIGASDAAAILGISPWATPHQLWLKKKSESANYSSEAMERGKRLEPVALELFNKQTGLNMIPAVGQCEEDLWHIASFDGLSVNGDAIVEIKVPTENGSSMKLAKEGVIPEHYKSQIQHQMMVSGLQKAYYFVFDGVESVLMEMEADNLYMRDLFEKEKAYYLAHIVGDEPPELTDRDYKYRNDESWHKHASNFAVIHAEIKRLEANLCIEKKALIELADGQNSKGGGVCFSQFFRKGSVDTDKLVEDLKIDLTKYRKKGSLVKMVSLQK